MKFKNIVLLLYFIAEVLNASFLNLTIQKNSFSKDNLFAENEAIIVLKEDIAQNSFIQKIKKAFPQIKITNQFSINNSIAIKLPQIPFDKIKNLFLNNPFLTHYIHSIEKNYQFIPNKSNDLYYNQLWAIENRGQKVNNLSGLKDADMDTNEAWNQTMGEKNIVVAILDTGIDYTHEDLKENMWDGNIHHGYDFAGDDEGNNDDDPMPDTPYDKYGHYHGTHVAGIIAAVGNNNKGIIGVAPNIEIMALKVFRPNGRGYSTDILEALDYINKKIDEGINIVAVNASFGGPGGKNGDAIDEAIKKLGQRGVIFCTAAGNDGKNIDNEPIYPAAYDAKNIITVAASDQNDKLASFSNYGTKYVDLVAPGSNILSTYPGNAYVYLDGTSMATPQLTGLVALLSSFDNRATIREKMDAILQSVDVKESLKGKVATAGRINAKKALQFLENSMNHPPKVQDEEITLYEDERKKIELKAEDKDKDLLNFTIINKPKHGLLKQNNAKITYIPKKDFYGIDSFSYIASDGVQQSNKATIYLKVLPINDAPIALDDNVTISIEDKIIIDVLKNDSDVDGDKLSIIDITKPLYGSAKIINNKIEYIAKKSYAGKESFHYTIKDSNGSLAKAKVTIFIKSKNHPPKVQDEEITLYEDERKKIELKAEDEDKDLLNFTIINKPKHGLLKQNNAKITYIPKKDFYGIDSFSYIASDGMQQSNKATIYLKVLPINDAPIALDDNVVIDEDNNITIDVLKNDGDIDGDKIVLGKISKPKNGQIEVINNKIKYIPNKNFYGEDSFTYHIKDSFGASSSAKVKIIIKAIDDKPVALNDEIFTSVGEKIIIDALKNDFDVENDSLQISKVTLAKYGIAKIIENKIEYRANKNGENKIDKIYYTIQESKNKKNQTQGVITIHIKKRNSHIFSFPKFTQSFSKSIIKINSSFTYEKKNQTDLFILPNNEAKILIDSNSGKLKILTQKAIVPKEELPRGTNIVYSNHYLKTDTTIENEISF